jgi:multidrug efflux system outer membrane protein
VHRQFCRAKSRRKRGLNGVGTGVVILAMTGCALRENAHAPVHAPLDAPDAFTQTGSAAITSHWWTAFNDAALNACIERALDSNFTLLAAWERLQTARALARRERADIYPSLDAEAGATFSDDRSERRVHLGLAAGYELDLWGNIKSKREAQQLLADASLADYQTSALSLSAELTTAWYDLCEARTQANLLKTQVETNEKVLALLDARFAAGLIRSADVLRQRQLLEATREQAIVIDARITLARHQIAVLQGRLPRAVVDEPAAGLPALPPLPDTGLPATLVGRRPDVQRAHFRLRAADRELATAISERYPRIQFSASLRTLAERPADLFSTWLNTLATELAAPLLTGGRLAANVQRGEAERAEHLAEYRQQVLTAFEEVENALLNERQQHARVQSIERQLTLAQQTYEQLHVQYANGVTDYLAVLAALSGHQRLQREQSSAQLELIKFRIALYRALAGSMTTPRERDTTEPEEDAPDHG